MCQTFTYLSVDWTGHRYRKYLELRDTWEMEEGGSLSSYYINNYHRCLTTSTAFSTPISRNRCYSGCPENTTCEWGLCQCKDPDMIQIWGECVPPDVTEGKRNGTLLELEMEGTACSSDSFCQDRDINALCFRSQEGEEGVCKCRQEMHWNRAAFECQVSIQQAPFLTFLLSILAGVHRRRLLKCEL